MKKLLNKEVVQLAISTLVLGLIVGLSSGLLSLLLELVEHFFLDFIESAGRPAPLEITGLHRLFSVFIGSIITALIWFVLRKKFKPPVGINAALKGKEMPFGETLIHVSTQIFYVGTGGSVGRELAPREAGVLLAQHWLKLLRKLKLSHISKENQLLLLAAAAGAGFAGVYIAPITGMLFAVEILLKKVSPRIVIVSLSMSVIAMLVGSLFKGFDAYYLIGDLKFSALTLIFVLIIAPICGLIGAYFRIAFKWAEAKQTRNKHVLWQLPIAGLVTGLIAMKIPEIMGNGRSLAQLSISSSGKNLMLFLLLAAVAKAVITVFTIRSGAAGGTLTPAIALGAVVGAVVGSLLVPYLSGISVAEAALLGACFLLAAAQQAPLMAMFMMIEISHLSYDAFLPLGLGVALAVGLSSLILKKWEKSKSIV